MRPLRDIGQRLDELSSGSVQARDAPELLQLGEETLEHWLRARNITPTEHKREGFRLLALHRQGAQGEPSFNACRETCRELVYHYNLLTLNSGDGGRGHLAQMMALVANHLFLFVSGKMETQQLGDFCCASKPLRTNNELDIEKEMV